MTVVAPGFRLQVASDRAHDKRCTLSDAAVADLMILATDGPGKQSILAGFATSGLNPCPSVLRIDAPSVGSAASISLAGDLFCSGFSNVKGLTYVSTITGSTLSNCSLDACEIPATWMSNIVRRCVLPPFVTVSSNCMGIGVSNPTYTLDIQGDIRASGNLVTKGVKMYRSAPAPAPDYSLWGTGGGGGGYVTWKQQSNVAATYVVHSNVGVGTSTPRFPLDVVGISRFDDIIIDGSLTSHGMVVDLAWMSNAVGWASNSHTTSSYSAVAPGAWTSTVKGTLVTGSNVGIGTPNPLFPLDVVGNIRATGAIIANGFKLSGVGNIAGASLSQCVVPYCSLTGAPWRVTAAGDAVLVANHVGIGTSNPQFTMDVKGTVRASGGFTAFSDARYKTDLQVIPDALNKLLQLNGYSFCMKDDCGTRRQVGLLAQEVLRQFPEVVHGDDDTGLSVAYGNMIAVLVEAIKTLDARIHVLEARS